MEPRAPRFSGALGQAPLFVPLAILIAVPVLSMAYAYVDVYSPIAGWISILFVFGFGISLAWSVGKAGHLARCRSPRFLRWMGVLAGVLGLYLSWAWFEYALLHRGDDPVEVGIVELATHPAGMWAIAESVAETGWYTIGSATPSGPVLWGFWGIEAALIVGLAGIGASAALDEHVYCESCERWCEADGAPKKLALPAEAAHESVRAGDVNALVGLAAATPDENDHLLLDLRRCSKCKESGALRLRRATTTLDKKGKPEQRVEKLLDYVQQGPAELERLSTLVRT